MNTPDPVNTPTPDAAGANASPAAPIHIATIYRTIIDELLTQPAAGPDPHAESELAIFRRAMARLITQASPHFALATQEIVWLPKGGGEIVSHTEWLPPQRFTQTRRLILLEPFPQGDTDE